VRRFPTRTLVLMVMALLAFLWMWYGTGAQRAAVREAREQGAPPSRP
jgi:hypothetical protein